ncbi:hypothetical protein [Streptosporangium sp. KLBMP 9127]|nr:hypothetical protein [Streptosporangium sp. KLBMP 9127]
MKPIALWAHEVRLAGLPALLGPPALAVLIVLLILFDPLLGSPDARTVMFLMILVEAGFPLLAGMAAASLPSRDPTVELRLTLSGGYRPVLLRRLAVSIGWCALCALAVTAPLASSGWWNPAYGGPAGQLVWLSPLLWLSGLGLLAAVALRNSAAAGSVVAFVWTLEQVVAGPLQENVVSRLLYLFATTRGAASEGWAGNRLTLLATALLLVLAAWFLLHDPERVLEGEPE